jgi:hypothetical protein
VEQTGSNFGAPIFEHSKSIAKIERTVTALAALLVKPDDNSSLAAEPSQSAQQLFSDHAPTNKTQARRRQAGDRAFG